MRLICTIQILMYEFVKRKQATTLRMQNSLDRSLDLIIGSRLLESNGQINNRNINSGDTESHSCQLSIEGRKHLANGLQEIK